MLMQQIVSQVMGRKQGTTEACGTNVCVCACACVCVSENFKHAAWSPTLANPQIEGCGFQISLLSRTFVKVVVLAYSLEMIISRYS